RRPPRPRAGAVQELRTRRRRRALAGKAVRVGPDTDQARFHVRPEERHQGDLSAGSVRSAVRAQLGCARLAIGAAAAVLGMATLAAGIHLHRPALLRLARRYVVIVLLGALGA